MNREDNMQAADKSVEPSALAAQANSSLASPSISDASSEIAELSAEEQMRRFEAALKEADWGHQPC